MLEAWKIAIICICAVLINAGVIIMVVYYYCFRKRKSQEQQQQQQQQQEFDIEKQENITVEEETHSSILEDQMEKYGQQFAIVTLDQTVLSPPRYQPNNNNSTVPPPPPAPEQQHTDLRVFSLSPLHEGTATVSPSDTISLRTITPFQQTTPDHPVWRGPTPVFTQYPGNKCT